MFSLLAVARNKKPTTVSSRGLLFKIDLCATSTIGGVVQQQDYYYAYVYLQHIKIHYVV